ncbi:MAG: DEAD/DEAH box helicase [Solirubrobacteraceae bacterium]
MSTPTFASLGVSAAVSGALASRGITEPFPVQTRVIPDALAGRDLLVRSPTGSGKSLAFGLPLVERLRAEDRRPSALVLVPTRELAAQIVEELRDVANARALGIAAVYGGAGIDKQARTARKAHIVVATPGRLEDLLSRGDLTLEHVRVLVLDEADRMLDMGFKPPVDRIVRRIQRDRQTLFFSATLDATVEKVAREYTRNAIRHEEAQTQEDRLDVEHRFIRVAHEAKLDALVHELRHVEGGRTLVFVRTKRGADRLVKRLRPHGVEASAMHGDKSQSQRERALRRFAGGESDLLIATDVAARGLDVEGITHVVNFDAPALREDYVHRVGRTGRAGATGVGITFVAPDQARDMARIVRELGLRAELGADHEDATPAPPRGSRSSRTGNGARRDARTGAAPTGRLVASARPSGRSGRTARGGRGRPAAR